jgi:hypothetical protein
MQLKWGEMDLTKVESIGTRILQIAISDITNTLTIADVYYISGFINILSYMRMRDKGMLFENDGKQPKLRFKENIVAYVNMPEKRRERLTLFPFTNISYVRYISKSSGRERDYLVSPLRPHK